MAETIKTKVQFKRLLLVLLTLIMLVTVTAFAASAATVVDSGTCGGNLTWQFDSDGVLTISGTGEMKSWNLDDEWTPWYSHSDMIKSVIIGNSVTTIGDYAFYDCTALKSITIPDSITSIGMSAFSRCKVLTSVTVPNSVTFIGAYAFYECKALTSITIPNRVTAIGDNSFSVCEALTSVTIPNSVTSIGDYAFSSCYALTSITIPNSVTSIGEAVFYYCEALTSVTIPNSVTAMGNDVFRNCKALKSVIIGNSVTAIGYSVFSDCEALTSVTIPNGVTTIGDYAFFNCKALTSVSIPDSVTAIGGYAFFNCASLTTANIGDGVTSIAGYAFSGTALYNNNSNWTGACLYIGKYLIAVKQSISGTYSIVNGTKFIADNAFYGCEALTSVTIPNSVTSIGADAFSYCFELKSITIPNSVTTIKLDAFYGCRSLKYVYYEGDSSDWSNISFVDAYSNPCCNGARLYCIVELTVPVTGLKVGSYGVTDLKLTWTKINGVTGYRVFKYNPTTKKYESYKNSSSNSLTVTGLRAGTQYYFKVRAYINAGGKVYWGDYSSFLKTATIPPTVTGLKVSSYGNTALKLTWTNISGVTGYKVYKYNPSTKKYESYKNSTSNSLMVTGLKSGTQYYFKVRAYKSISGRIYWGNCSSFLKTATRPLNAKISSVSSPSSGRLTAKWGKVSGATGYYVQYSTNSRFSGAKAKYVNTNYINLTGLTGGTTYYVRVRPFVQIGSARIYSPALSAYKYVKIR